MDRTKKTGGIDLFKFIMSICVVAIHTQPLVNCTNKILLRLFNCITGCAVPFFFLVTGYLLGIKYKKCIGLDEKIDVLKKYLFKILRLYILWNIIYFPLALVEYIRNGNSFLHNIALYIRGLFFIGEHYNSWILWYLLATIYALILIIVLLKLRVPEKRIVICGFILISLYFVIREFVSFSGELLPVLAFLKRLITLAMGNGRVLSGVFYISLGLFYGDKKISNKVLMIVLAIGLFAGTAFDGIFEGYAITLASVMLFYIVLNMNISNNRYLTNLRKMSTVIYFIHMYVWTAYYTIVYSQKTYGLDSFIVTVLVCVLLSCLYVSKGRMRLHLKE